MSSADWGDDADDEPGKGDGVRVLRLAAAAGPTRWAVVEVEVAVAASVRLIEHP